MARVDVVAAGAIAYTAAERLTTRIEHAIAARDIALVALAGGATPRATYEALADASRPWRVRIDWSRVHLYWGDERQVPPDHPDSNFGLANRALVQHVAIPAAHVHRIRGELADPHAAATEYALELPKAFDVMLLGLGEDCHIASLFPGSPRLVPDNLPVRGQKPVLTAGSNAFTGRRIAADSPGASVTVAAETTARGWRITVTPPTILNSRAIVVLVAGENKAAAVARAINGPADVTRCPGQLLRQAADRVEWILDMAAASRLDEAMRS